MLSKAMIKKTGIVFIGNILSQLFALTFMIVATRILTKEEYGYVSYVISMGSFFATIVAGGFPVALTRYISKDPYRKREYIANGLFGTLVFFFIVLVPVVILFFKYMEIIAIIFVSMLMMFYLGVLRGEKKFKIYAIVNSGRNGVKLTILSLLIFIGAATKHTVIWTYAIGGIFVLFFAEAYYHEHGFTLPRYEPTIFKTLLKFSIPLLITTVFYSLTSTSGIAIINAYLGKSAVATYKNALLLLMVYGFVPGAIGIILLPKISSTTSPKVVIKNLRDSIFFSLFIEILIFISALLVGKPLIILFLGEKYADVFPLFIIMSFGMFFATIRNMFSALWEGTGRPWISMTDMIVAGTSITVLTLILILHFNIMSAAYSYSLGFAFAALTDILFFVWGKHKRWFEKATLHL